MIGAHVKGSALREFVVWLERTHHLEHAVARLAKLEEAERLGLEIEAPALGLLASSWYPVETAHLLLDVVTRGMTEVERDRLAREGSRAATDQAIRGIYRVVFERLGSPERYARAIPRLWGLLHDTGSRKIEILRPGEALSTTEGWLGHHPFLCRLTVETMAALIEKMGYRDVRTTQIACVSWGDPHCETKVHWRPR